MPPDDLQLDELTNATLMKLEQFRDRTATGQSHKHVQRCTPTTALDFKTALKPLKDGCLHSPVFVFCVLNVFTNSLHVSATGSIDVCSSCLFSWHWLFPEIVCSFKLMVFFFFTKDYDKKSWFFFLVKIDKLNAILFFRSNVRDRNTESYGPEGESDGLLRHHSTDRLLQWHSEHCTLGSWTFPGQKVQSLTLGWS